MGTMAMKMVGMASQWCAAASKKSRDWAVVRPGCKGGGAEHRLVNQACRHAPGLLETA